MLLPNKDGIKCDWCGAIMKDEFQYYSIECTLVDVDRKRASTKPVEVDNNTLDFDVCPECHQERVQLMRKFNGD